MFVVQTERSARRLVNRVSDANESFQILQANLLTASVLHVRQVLVCDVQNPGLPDSGLLGIFGMYVHVCLFDCPFCLRQWTGWWLPEIAQSTLGESAVRYASSRGNALECDAFLEHFPSEVPIHLQSHWHGRMIAWASTHGKGRQNLPTMPHPTRLGISVAPILFATRPVAFVGSPAKSELIPCHRPRRKRPSDPPWADVKIAEAEGKFPVIAAHEWASVGCSP